MLQLKDLIYALKILAVPSQKGRATKGAALALLGRHLYQDNFAKAATTLESVITAGNYSLVADYNSIFKRRVKMELNPF
jgi:hypothetical protein